MEKIKNITPLLKEILDDIYSVDKSLKAHEDSLIIIIQELLRAKPEIKIDEIFISELRAKVLEKSKLLDFQSCKNMPNISWAWPFKKFVFVGATMALIATVILINLPKGGGNLAIKDMGDNAFGDILFSPSTADQKSSDSSVLRSGEEGAGSSSFIESTVPLGMGSGSISSEGLDMVAPFYYEPTNYNYVYAGKDFEVSDKGEVYRRTAGDAVKNELKKIAGKMNLNFINLDNFQNTNINSMEISEDREFGYSIYIDARQNNVSINMNWEKWPSRDSFPSPLSMPNDEEIISISDKFLSDYGINKGKYGKGEIVEQQEYYILESKEGGAPARGIIENVSVIYPLEINGQTVYDQGGNKYGMGLSVDLKYKKVTGAYNIVIGDIESSVYDIETDTTKILNFVKNGGMFGNYTYPEAKKTVNVEIGDPKKGLVQIWKTEEGKYSSFELFVPALIFPVNSVSDQTNFYRSSIVVPLVGEMMNQDNGPVRVLDIPAAE
ncbi:MAG: hypothetical protein PHW72_03185 [Candidatus Pacebacteria bacterium]|nr:hypothetical protein [Candidatus Paceibacterota bacterium]